MRYKKAHGKNSQQKKAFVGHARKPASDPGQGPHVLGGKHGYGRDVGVDSVESGEESGVNGDAGGAFCAGGTVADVGCAGCLGATGCLPVAGFGLAFLAASA